MDFLLLAQTSAFGLYCSTFSLSPKPAWKQRHLNHRNLLKTSFTLGYAQTCSHWCGSTWLSLWVLLTTRALDGVSTHSHLEKEGANCPELSVFLKRQKWEETLLHVRAEPISLLLHRQHWPRPPGPSVTNASSLSLLMTDNLKCCHPRSPENSKDSNFLTCYYEVGMMEGILRSSHPST